MDLLRSSPCYSMSILANPMLSSRYNMIPSRTDKGFSVFVLKSSSLKSYTVSRKVKLQVSASLPRRGRRNTLREKFVAREVQVNDIPKLSTIDRNPQVDRQNSTETETGGGKGSHDCDLPVKEITGTSSQEGEVDENVVDSTERCDIPRESALSSKLDNWVEQYKKDSEFWGIGSGPIFTVHRDSTGVITKVDVNEDEIVRRTRIGTFSHHQGDKKDPDVSEKISRAKVMAKGILSGEYVLPKNSSVVKFEDTKSSLVLRFRTVIPQGKAVLQSSPRIAFGLLCGYLFFWTAKNILVVRGSSELTREEEEMLRRKLKARKETVAREKGSVEVIQTEEPDQIAPIRNPLLDKGELAKDIARSKTLTHIRPAVSKSSSTGDPTFGERIREIREMARKARDSERQELQKDSEVKGNFLSPKDNGVQEEFASSTADSQNEPTKAEGGLSSVVGTPTNESAGSQQREVEHSVPQKLSSQGEASDDQSLPRKASSSSISPNNTKHKLIRSVKEAREYLNQKNKIQQAGLLSHNDENCGGKPKHGSAELVNGKKNQKTEETNESVEISEVNTSRFMPSQNLFSEFYSAESKTNSVMDEGVTEDNAPPAIKNPHLSVGKTNVGSFINGSGNTSPKGSQSNRATMKSSSETVGIDNANKRLNGGSIYQESDSMKNDEPQEREKNLRNFQVDGEVSNASSASAINGKEKPPLNRENMVLNSSDFSVHPTPVKKHVTEKECVDSLLSSDSDGLSLEPSSMSDNASIQMKNEKDFISDRETVKESNGADPPKDSKSSSQNNWLEENFQQFEPVVEKIGSGFRENFMTAKLKAEENTIAKAEISELDLFDIDDEFEWMKDEKLKEIVFQVRENELAGRNPFHLINDDDRAAFVKGLEKKADKLNTKLLGLHEWIHSRIENIAYGTDGISLYDPPEKIMPRWKGPAIDRYPEFLSKPVNAKSDPIQLDKSSCDTTNKLKDSEESRLDGVSAYPSSHDIRNKSETNVSNRQKTVIECSDGTSRAGKKGSNEHWQHTKKWSRGFLEVYNSETDPEVKSIMKDMGKDLDRWITEKEVQDVADLMKMIPAKKRNHIEKKLAKLEREMEMFGPQAVVSKYKEYSDEAEEDYLWWLDLKYVLFIELYTLENDVAKVGFYSLEMAADLELNPKQHHVIGFEDPGDSKNFCYIVQAHLEMLGKGSAFVVARPPKDAFREAKGNGFNVTVIRKGELKLNIDQPLEEVDEEIIEIGSKMYHDKIMRERGVDIHAVMKGVFSSKSSKR